MNIKTPKFWRKTSFVSILLLPLSLLYWLLFHLNKATKRQYRSSLKVVCIGNLTAGGSGKTPVAIAIGNQLRARGVKFAFLSSGYKGRDVDFVKVDEGSTASEVGDEPMLLSEVADTFVTNDRVLAVKKLEEMDYEMVVLDDGLQNNSLHKDYKVVVVDGLTKFGNGLLLPAGPLRQSVASGLREADKVLVVGEADYDIRRLLQKNHVASKLAEAKIEAKDCDILKERPVMAFCGLAYPEKFFNFVCSMGFDVIETIEFCDHYHYKNSDLEGLLKKAEEKNAILLTTKKDWVKFEVIYKKRINYLEINLRIEDFVDEII